MKKIFAAIYLLALLGYHAYAQQKPSVTLRGTLAHFTNEVEVQDMSEFQYLLPPLAERLILPEDSTGKFRISFPLQAPNYFRIGRNILYLTPGDDLTVFIDYNNPALATFKGRGSEANMFLRQTPFPKAGSYIEAGSKTQETPQQTIEYILQAGANRSKQLDRVINISAAFKQLEKGRIKADIINSLLDGQITFYRPRSIRKDSMKMKIYGEEYEALIKPVVASYSKDFVDASLLKVAVYRDLTDSLVNQPGNAAELQKIRDWMKATAIIEEMKKVSDKQMLKNFSTTIGTIKTLAYKKALNKTLAILLKFGKGDMASDFAASDLNGNTVMLSSLKGKVIYVDLWATWCGPCLAEMPHYEELKEKYKDNREIAFVSLSIDDNISLWKSSVANRKAGGYQWLINRNKLDAYNIVSIPRILLIDKDFKMVDMNAPVPSSKKLPDLIEALLK
jgi:thiol-disulfide isomerase/thioredoxin